MAAEQNEKAYQKQLGVNVGCVSQPRLNPRASPARASPCFFPPHRERRHWRRPAFRLSQQLRPQGQEGASRQERYPLLQERRSWLQDPAWGYRG